MSSTQRLNHNMRHRLEETVALSTSTSWLDIVVFLLKAGCPLEDIAHVLAKVRPMTVILPNAVEECVPTVSASHGENL